MVSAMVRRAAILHYIYELEIAIASCRISQAAVGAKPAAGEPHGCTDFWNSLSLISKSDSGNPRLTCIFEQIHTERRSGQWLLPQCFTK